MEPREPRIEYSKVAFEKMLELLDINPRGIDRQDGYWLSEEGIQRSVEFTRRVAQVALSSSDHFWDLAKFGSKGKFREIVEWQAPHSPFEWTFVSGIHTLASPDSQEMTEECRKLYCSYPTDTFIAASLFAECRIGISELTNPMETEIALANVGLAWDEVRKTGSIETLMNIMSEEYSFQAFLTPKGRVAFYINPTIQVLSNHELLDIAIKRVEENYGDQGRFFKSVICLAEAAGLKCLLKDRLAASQT